MPSPLVLSPFIALEAPKIASGASISEDIIIHGGTVTKLVIPAGFTGTTMTFQVTLDGTNWFNLYDSYGVEVSVAVAASRVVSLPLDLLMGCQKIRLRSGTAASGVNQVSTVSVGVLARTFN